MAPQRLASKKSPAQPARKGGRSQKSKMVIDSDSDVKETLEESDTNTTSPPVVPHKRARKGAITSSDAESPTTVPRLEKRQKVKLSTPNNTDSKTSAKKKGKEVKIILSDDDGDSSHRTGISTTARLPHQENDSVKELVPVKKADEESIVYFEDIQEIGEMYRNSHAEKPPAMCEVMKGLDQDPMLTDTYGNLPNLRKGAFTTNNNGPNPYGPFRLSSVPDNFPGADMRLIINAITFSKAGKFINPSRAAPSTVKPAVMLDSSTTSYAVLANANNNFAYATFTSVMLVTSSNLHEPNPQGIFHRISGLLCLVEWERFSSFFCMAFKVEELHAQIWEDSISVSTRAKSSGGGTGTGLSKRLTMGSPSKSPVKSTGLASRTYSKPTLNFEEKVPIYNGRGGGFSMSELHNISTLPEWENELMDCICLVGYTANTWKARESTRKQFSLNIQWAVVLASPN